jgi:hypothetical protein
METRNRTSKQPDIGDRRKAFNRRTLEERRKSDDRRNGRDRRSGSDRRSGWGKIEDLLLRGALAATASIVFQFSRPFTIILGYVDLLLASSREENTKQKLFIIKEQLEIISEILDDFREVDSFKTKDFDGVDILDTNKLLDVKQDELDRKIL